MLGWLNDSGTGLSDGQTQAGDLRQAAIYKLSDLKFIFTVQLTNFYDRFDSKKPLLSPPKYFYSIQFVPIKWLNNCCILNILS